MTPYGVLLDVTFDMKMVRGIGLESVPYIRMETFRASDVEIPKDLPVMRNVCPRALRKNLHIKNLSNVARFDSK